MSCTVVRRDEESPGNRWQFSTWPSILKKLKYLRYARVSRQGTERAKSSFMPALCQRPCVSDRRLLSRKHNGNTNKGSFTAVCTSTSGESLVVCGGRILRFCDDGLMETSISCVHSLFSQTFRV